MSKDKDLAWIGSSLADLSAFPVDAKRAAGFNLRRVQRGLNPERWKPVNTVGVGAREIRITAESGEHRVIYVATLGTCVYVLHAFHKKTEKTSKSDIDMAERRYRLAKAEVKANEKKRKRN